ncbi:MAG: Na+/H+ antiporter [uncultured Sulfurovum sp.]|uniref:Na+/H+ antiporter n=1 Tax=uncultured Sulfurovum sp. TaxID=269237 RepID=A0A6S6U0G2_9BACT|nr:MAG: Na+/H+ antiporter [uncultured Sulfurovum sp.]
MEYGIISIAIPLLTIILAIITKDVIVSLLGGIFVGLLVLNDFSFLDTIIAFFDGIVAQFAQGWITKTLLFMLFVGAIIRILSDAGAVERFVAYLSLKSERIDSPKGAMLLAYVIGVVIFIESSITSMVAATVAKPLCDKNNVSREKLAYICDSTSAPVCTIVPLNGWGALLLGLIVAAIDAHVIGGDAVSLLLEAIIFNFYAWVTLLIVLLVILFNINIGPMKHAKAKKYENKHANTDVKPSLWHMVLPIVVVVGMVPLALLYTGKGDIFAGSGSTSVYYATIVTLIFMYFYFVPTKNISHKNYFKSLYNGMGEMLPVTLILLFAIYIGDVIGDLGTAKFIAHLLDGNISPMLIPLLVFLVSSMTAFATGTSWGTFSIMLPIALALGATMDLHIPLLIAAVMSGGVFGDHTSPISDTTIISSMAAGCDHIEHVRTQIPYALIGGVLAAVAFLVSGWAMV